MPYTMEDFDREFKEKALKMFTPEELVRGIYDENGLKGNRTWVHAVYFASLTPADRVRGLTTDQLLQCLSMEEMRQLRELLSKNLEVLPVQQTPQARKPKAKSGNSNPGESRGSKRVPKRNTSR